MKKLFLPLLLVVLVVACDHQPVNPEIDSPLFRAEKSDVLIEGIDNFTDYVQCANDGDGESLHWYGPWRITGTAVASNSGNVNQRWDFEYLEGYTITGLTSGDVWTVLENQFNNTTHSLHNGNWVRNSVFLETYGNQDGDQMFVQTTLHATLANGEWRVWRGAVTACNLR